MLRFDNPRMEGRRRKGKKYAGFPGIRFASALEIPFICVKVDVGKKDLCTGSH